MEIEKYSEIDKRRNSGYMDYTSTSYKMFIYIFWVDEIEKLEEILIDIKNNVLAHPAQPK